MFDLIKNRNQRKQTKDEMITQILNFSEHHWIKENQYVSLHMTEFFERLPYKILYNVFYEKSTILVRANGKFACSVSNHHQNVILVFAELYNNLTKINDHWAKAVLAHEVAHIHLNHHENDDIMETQVDADEFACEMGYLDQLEDFLHEQADSVEKRVRLSFITTYYFAKNPHDL